MDHPEEGRYRPIDRTPPDYQTIIKLLLVASLLDVSSLGTDGPKQARQQDIMDSLPQLSPATRETLEQLGVAEKDWPSPGPRTPPLVVRMLGMLLFNSVFFWTDLGSGMLYPTEPSFISRPLSDSHRWGNLSHKENKLVSSLVNNVTLVGVPPEADDVWTEVSQWAGRILKGVLEAFLSRDSAEGVPWFAQLVSLALLVLIVYAVPRCPIVLENACNFLM